MRKNEQKRRKRVGKHPTNSEVQMIISDIRSLRVNKTDEEIRALLGLELRTFQKYMKRIHDSDQEIWFNITSTELESHFLLLKESYENHYREAKTLFSQERDNAEKLEILNDMDNCRVNIIMLLIESPTLTDRVRIEGTALPPHQKRTSLLTK